MSIAPMAVVNGVLVAALLAALFYVCSLPFRLRGFDRVSVGSVPMVGGDQSESESWDERRAA